jgi:hypothetical protein
MVHGEMLSPMTTRTNFQIDKALQSHQAWKNTFQSAIDGLDAEKLLQLEIDATGCEFGLWLKSVCALPIATTPAFTEVITTHAEFHRIASEIVSLLHRAEVDAAQHLLDTAFQSISLQLSEELRILGTHL